MTSPLQDAKLRLEWAKSQIGDFERAIQAFFARKPYRFILDMDTKPGRILHRVTFTETIPDEWKRHVTEIGAHLREPLDYAAVAVGESLHSKNASFLCFPIKDTKNAFEREMKDRKIDRLCPPLADFLRSLNPYKGPNDLLFGLHELSRTNKHRKMAIIGMTAPTITRITSLSGNAAIWPTASWVPAENSLIILDRSNDSEFDGNIQVAIGIALSELSGFERQPITAVFLQMAQAVQNILAEFERQFFP